ncbi:Hsp20/alpha crystallin family protein [Ilyomonas limi]|uniref:Hsp20/alpha crystallin family protein n=1 Tax=Ilyomonas limi TaxID=2575867 RepID=A0A4U3KQC2_9BACT|nr:Hsp20/alpha crystallin family protein [Ilyomonas limi]TKK64420.1 Hsp20/alpha crystallin family protein [Ilyomonas limi]
MTLVKHNYRNLNNLFDEFFTTVPAAWSKDLNVPPVNIHESNDAFNLDLQAPGLNKEDFKISVEKGLLTISYEHKTEEESKDVKTYRKEFATRSFKRTFSVDEKINADAITAKYDAGVLKLTLPKKEEVKVQPKQIAIQ